MFFTTMEAEGDGWDPVKLAKAPSSLFIYFFFFPYLFF